MQERENKFYIILGIYLTSLIVANITAAKVVSLWGLSVLWVRGRLSERKVLT